MSYEIVKYRAEFRGEVIELQKILFSLDIAVNSAYFAWKYERNPYLEEPLIYLALYEGKVVGMRGIFGAKWENSRGQSWLGVCATDLSIAPEHRKRGLFTQIMRLALDDLAQLGHTYVFNLSANKTTYFSSLATGWHGVGSVQPMLWTKTGNPWHSLDRNGKLLPPAASPYVKLEYSPRPEAMADLVELIGSDGRIRHLRDQQYFAWRYQNPLSKYRFLYWEASRLRGYLVLRASIHAYNADIEIVDWEAADEQVRADLLHAAIEWGAFDNITIWSSTLPVEAKTLLESKGFRLLQQTDGFGQSFPTILVRPVRDELLKKDWVSGGLRLLDSHNWDLRMIYSDGH
jgi:GNAT superfamily N-acetyltransferase